MYLLVAAVITAIVIVLAWRGLGTRAEAEAQSRPVPPRRPSRPTRIVAPDDDPDFLNEIDRKLKDGRKDSGDAGSTEAPA